MWCLFPGRLIKKGTDNFEVIGATYPLDVKLSGLKTHSEWTLLRIMWNFRPGCQWSISSSSSSPSFSTRFACGRRYWIYNVAKYLTLLFQPYIVNTPIYIIEKLKTLYLGTDDRIAVAWSHCSRKLKTQVTQSPRSFLKSSPLYSITA